MMAYALLDNFEPSCATGQLVEEHDEDFLERMRATDMSVVENRRTDRLRIWRGVTVPLTPAETDAYLGWLQQLGHVWTFDSSSMLSNKSLGPAAGSNYTAGVSGGVNGTCVTVASGDTLRFNAGLSTSWAILHFKKVSGTWVHYGRTSNGDEWKDGVAGTHNVTNWSPDPTSGEVRLEGKDTAGAGASSDYDNLVVLPFVPTDAQMAAWTDVDFYFRDDLTLDGDIVYDKDYALVRPEVTGVEYVQGHVDGTWYDNLAVVSYELREVDPSSYPTAAFASAFTYPGTEPLILLDPRNLDDADNGSLSDGDLDPSADITNVGSRGDGWALNPSRSGDTWSLSKSGGPQSNGALVVGSSGDAMFRSQSRVDQVSEGEISAGSVIAFVWRQNDGVDTDNRALFIGHNETDTNDGAGSTIQVNTNGGGGVGVSLSRDDGSTWLGGTGSSATLQTIGEWNALVVTLGATNSDKRVNGGVDSVSDPMTGDWGTADDTANVGTDLPASFTIYTPNGSSYDIEIGFFGVWDGGDPDCPTAEEVGIWLDEEFAGASGQGQDRWPIA